MLYLIFYILAVPLTGKTLACRGSNNWYSFLTLLQDVCHNTVILCTYLEVFIKYIHCNKSPAISLKCWLDGGISPMRYISGFSLEIQSQHKMGDQWILNRQLSLTPLLYNQQIFPLSEGRKLNVESIWVHSVWWKTAVENFDVHLNLDLRNWNQNKFNYWRWFCSCTSNKTAWCLNANTTTKMARTCINIT